MATPQGALKKTALLAAAMTAAGIALVGQAQEASAAPAFVNLTVLDQHGAPVYAQPTSSSTRYRVEKAGTTLRIQCSTTKTPSGALWFRIYDSQPTGWVYSGHFQSLVHPPKECFPG
ncbi:SH3 domain-containing protein [Streptomyces sp. NPDC026659]|uniref:SH3 domain-containing protein n=1 Tax=Streptomyces sp. NPDC026659 TaxID=3155123 RepID=UPI0033D9FF07